MMLAHDIYIVGKKEEALERQNNSLLKYIGVRYNMLRFVNKS